MRVIQADGDPDLIADSLPFALKLYESLLGEDPYNADLLLAAAGGYGLYANAFVHTPATMLAPERYEERSAARARAKSLYLRGRDFALRGLERALPGTRDGLRRREPGPALAEASAAEVPFLYWTAACWMGAFSTDSFDMKLALDLPLAVAFMERALELDPDFMDGAVHEFFLLYYGTLPKEMGGDDERATRHFEEAVRLSDGELASPYVALAKTVAVRRQDAARYRQLLETALAVDANDVPQFALRNALAQREAQWYLDNVERFFLDPYAEAGTE